MSRRPKIRRRVVRVGDDRRKDRLTESDRERQIKTRLVLRNQGEDNTNSGGVKHVRRTLDADAQATHLGDPSHQFEEDILRLSNSRMWCAHVRGTVHQRVQLRIAQSEIDIQVPASAQVFHRVLVALALSMTHKVGVELQRHVKDGINVIVFEPGFMPGTGLSREQAPAVQSIVRTIGRLPGVSKPTTSAPMFASIALDEKWSHLHGGDYVIKNKLTEVKPFATDRERELRLWQATNELLESAK